MSIAWKLLLEFFFYFFFSAIKDFIYCHKELDALQIVNQYPQKVDYIIIYKIYLRLLRRYKHLSVQKLF